MGRALLASPEILLMDEPLASLDTERKLEILPLIESLRDNLRIPIVYVSHAIEEVARLASRVVVLDNGHGVAAGTVEDVLGPGLSGTGLSRFAQSSVVTGRLATVDAAYDLTEISHPAGAIWLTGRAGPIGREARVVIRATDITLAKTHPQNLSVRTTLAGTVAGIEADDDGPLAGSPSTSTGMAIFSHWRRARPSTSSSFTVAIACSPWSRTVALDERAVPALIP